MATKRRKRVGIIPKLLLAVFVIYVAVTLVINQVKTNRLNEETKEYNELAQTEETRVAGLKQDNESEPDDEYKRKEAQKQGYAEPNERVFIDISGS